MPVYPFHLTRFRLTAAALVTLLALTAFSRASSAAPQQSSAPVVVQPGAPGQPTKTLPADSHATLPPLSPGDVSFMQGMIMHHSQAVEMTALIPTHTDNKDLRLLGERISASQTDEIKFMQHWLTLRGQSTSMPGMTNSGAMNPASMPDMNHDNMNMDMSSHPAPLMPGMLTPAQMEALRKAHGDEFDHLFLTGMIQHHNGALIMVKELFNTPGAGQDADIFNFANDADNTQRAEIRIMRSMLDKKTSEKPSEEKR